MQLLEADLKWWLCHRQKLLPSHAVYWIWIKVVYWFIHDRELTSNSELFIPDPYQQYNRQGRVLETSRLLINTYRSLPSTYPKKLLFPPSTHTHGLTHILRGRVGYKHLNCLCIWLMLVFLSYMIVWDKCLLRQFWILHSHTLFILPLLPSHLLLSRLVCQKSLTQTLTAPLSVLFHWWEREAGGLRRHAEKHVTEAACAQASERYSNCSRWKYRLLLILVPDYLWNSHQEEAGLCTMFPFICFSSQGRPCSKGREKAPVSSDTRFPLHS